MTYIPPGPNTERLVYSSTKVWDQRLNTRRPWVPKETRSFSNEVVSGWREKSFSPGKPIMIRGTRWLPVKPYHRKGKRITASGGPEECCNKPSLDRSTIRETWTGFMKMPPTSLLLVFRCSAADTQGLVDADYPVLDSNTQTRLITECMVKVGGRKANYGESLGESRKTLNHLAKTSSSVLRAVLALRRGRFRDFARALGVSGKKGWVSKEASSRWLEYQYAWMPLLNDIYDTHEVLKKGIQRKAQIFSATRQLHFSGQYSRDSSLTGSVLSGNVQVRHRCKLWYRLRDSDIDSLSRLGLINPVEVAWALMPFSFVIDWFIPVGRALEAWSATMGLTFIDGVISSKAEINASCKHERLPSEWSYLTDQRFLWVANLASFRRLKVINAKPGIYTKSPFSTKHVTSALALLRSLRS